MTVVNEKYEPTEILQIIQANYIQQQQYDDIVLKSQILNLDTTIWEWRDICDLVNSYELWEYLNYYFCLTADRETWMTILEPEVDKTLLLKKLPAYVGSVVAAPPTAVFMVAIFIRPVWLRRRHPDQVHRMGLSVKRKGQRSSRR